MVVEAASASTSGRAGEPTSRPSMLARFVPTLTTTSHLSALVFSSFLLVHLGSPLASALRLALNFKNSAGYTVGSPSVLAEGCTEAASRWQILGRVYYQGAIGELLFVWAPALLHVASSVGKRGIMMYLARKRRRVDDRSERRGGGSVGAVEESRDPDVVEQEKRVVSAGEAPTLLPLPMPLPQQDTPWKLPTVPNSHVLSAYLLLPLLLSHLVLHRLRPLSPFPPINSLSPSELDYAFVHFGTKVYPLAYPGLLAALTGLAAYHVVGGVEIIAQRWAVASKRQRKRKRRNSRGPLLPTLFVSTLTLLGLWGIAKDEEASMHLFSSGKGGEAPVGTSFTWMGKRMNAVFTSVWPFFLL